MKIKKKNLKYAIIALALIGVAYILFSKSTITGSAIADQKAPGEYDEFAKCLTQKGAKFYGAWWCPHCSDQKNLFGNSMQYVDYIECSDSAKNLLAPCIEAQIQSIPTWIFADGSREGGMPLEALAAKTGCPLS